MLPNYFPDQGGTPEFNSVDASLWFVIVAVGISGAHADGRAQLVPAIEAILARLRRRHAVSASPRMRTGCCAPARLGWR